VGIVRIVRGAIVLLAGLALAGSAHAAPPAVSTSAAPSTGAAPLRVTLTAAGEPATYAWDFGDGTAPGAGPSVQHVHYGEHGNGTAVTIYA
jgi:PKD repeat protein